MKIFPLFDFQTVESSRYENLVPGGSEGRTS